MNGCYKGISAAGPVIVQTGTAQFLINQHLIYRRQIAQVSRWREPGERLEIPDEMRLVKISRVVGNGCKGHFVLSDQFEARFETVDFVE